jgi:hypothetical protein
MLNLYRTPFTRRSIRSQFQQVICPSLAAADRFDRYAGEAYAPACTFKQLEHNRLRESDAVDSHRVQEMKLCQAYFATQKWWSRKPVAVDPPRYRDKPHTALTNSM